MTGGTVQFLASERRMRSYATACMCAFRTFLTCYLEKKSDGFSQKALRELSRRVFSNFAEYFTLF